MGRLNRRSTAGLYLALLVSALPMAPVLAQQSNPERNVYYGETHLHTSWSFDAFAFGDTQTGPEEFYQYAQGKPTLHPGGYEVTITKPLDWGAVTEHVDFMGLIQEAMDPDSALRNNSPLLARALKAGVKADSMLAFKVLSATMAKGVPIKDFVDPSVVAPVWKRIIDIADKYNQPGKFTTFAAYEWTSTPDSKNLHRNIFFRDSKHVPQVPFAPSDSPDPRDLWNWMDQQRAAGNELLAISHNANLSDGVMFPTEVDHAGRPIDQAWAEARLRNEPLSEIKQVKGQSETTPGLSPNDEFANYEVFVWHLLGKAGPPPKEYGSYVRQAYKDGVTFEQARGYNPYKFGVMSGSDSHVSVVPYRQENFFGVHGTVDDTPTKRVDGATVLGLNSLWVTPAGLSAVWAEENTRGALFDAMKRKETYSTSGVRIPVRFFGGWSFDPTILEQKSWVKSAYAIGVPMGADLPMPEANAKAPSFVVSAVKDPDSANLDRIQIVKGWSKNGQSFEKIYDVAWAGDRKPDPVTGKVPAIGSTVNISTGTYTNTIGAVELKAVWTDPEFDPSLDAFYYTRVLEIPTPRWSTIQAVKLGRLPPSGPGFSPIIQERAWSSPIWYTPGAQARKAARPGITVAKLKQQGAMPLDDEQLKTLVVGKTVHVTNSVTGQQVEILYGATGQRLVTAIDGKPTNLLEAGALMHGGDIDYTISDGRLSTIINGSTFDVAVYKLGDKYFATRSNEFGYANYEIAPEKL